MNVFLWIVQALLAALFGLAGLLKLSQPKEKLGKNLPWVEDFSPGTVKFIGLVELLGALGLILPAVTGIAVILTPLAATGLAVVMVLASAVHVRRKELSSVPITVALLAIAVVVAWGRFGPYSF